MNQERTSELFRELAALSPQPDGFLLFQERHGKEITPSLKEYLNGYLAAHPELKLPQIIFDSNSDRNYTYQLFNGHREHPDKYKLIPICMAMHMTVREIDRVLFLAGQPKLYAKNERDAALIICINRNYHTLTKINEFLDSYGLPTL